MLQLNNKQQKALETYRSIGELGVLSNILIEDCLEELKNTETRIRFNSLSHLDFVRGQINKYGFGNGCRQFESLYQYEMKLIIQTLLSRTVDGKAVIPFLDKKTDFVNSYVEDDETDERDLAYLGGMIERLSLIPESAAEAIY